MNNYLKVKNGKIVDGGNKPVFLRGVNLGGWLMMEAYFMHSPNRPEQTFRKNFSKALGAKALDEFDHNFRRNFIREQDFRDIARLGFNCLRVPFHHRLIEKAPFQYDERGLRILDQVLKWGEKYKIWMILDLHAAPGSQNHDWHSDSLGQAQLWKSKVFQQRTVALWQFLAERYRSKQYLAGYDLLNESVVGDAKLLNSLYKRIIDAIRSADQNHILFIEGNTWATDIGCLDKFNDDNYVLSIHSYEPLDFTFNFVPHLVYKKIWSKQAITDRLTYYAKVANKHCAPVFVGEFGVNGRQGFYGEHRWLQDTLACYKEFGFHWTYWTYKAVKNSAFPDGIFSYIHNPPWVNRMGPLMGWDTYANHWRKQKKHMIRSWHTDQFEANKVVLEALTNAV